MFSHILHTSIAHQLTTPALHLQKDMYVVHSIKVYQHFTSSSFKNFYIYVVHVQQHRPTHSRLLLQQLTIYT